MAVQFYLVQSGRRLRLTLKAFAYILIRDQVRGEGFQRNGTV